MKTIAEFIAITAFMAVVIYGGALLGLMFG